MKSQGSLNPSLENKSQPILSNIFQDSSLYTKSPIEQLGKEVQSIDLQKDQKIISPTRPVLGKLDSQGGIRIDITISASAFTLGRLLGKGGFGMVYAGIYNGKPVAIKQLSAHLTEEALKELKHEAEIMMQLVFKSDRIVAIHGICLESPYSLVMELMTKGSLYDLLHSSQQLPWPIRYQIALDAAWGLKDLHEYKILHRDLKSLNILLDDRLRAKLADFGLAKVKHETSSQSSVAKGTVLWMAPELFDEDPKMTAASDIYSFGMVLWELVTRALPYAKATNQMVAARWIEKGIKEVIPGDCPPEIKSLIEFCWESTPAKRPTAAQVMGQLKPLTGNDEKFRPSSALELPQPVTPKPTPSQPKSLSPTLIPTESVTTQESEEKLLENLLGYVTQGESDKAEKLIQKDKNLLLQSARVKDLAGREFKQITAFQYALWAMDHNMWKMIQKYLPQKEQIKQFDEWEKKGTPYGKHFDFRPLLDEAKEQPGKRHHFDDDSYQRNQWNKTVGKKEEALPVHITKRGTLFPFHCWFKDRSKYEYEDLIKAEKLFKDYAEQLEMLSLSFYLSPTYSQNIHTLTTLKSGSKPVNQKVLQRLLQFVVGGDKSKVNTLISQDNSLLLHKGKVTDLSGRSFTITAFQYALWALDASMWETILWRLPHKEAQNQLEELESKGTGYGHFNLEPSIELMQTYIDGQNSISWKLYDKSQAYWDKISRSQIGFPVHIVHKYSEAYPPTQMCNSHRFFGYEKIDWFKRPTNTLALRSSLDEPVLEYFSPTNKQIGAMVEDCKLLRSVWADCTKKLDSLRSKYQKTLPSTSSSHRNLTR